MFHILEEDIKQAIPAEVYAAEVGAMEIAMDADTIRAPMESVRAGEWTYTEPEYEDE